MPSNKAAKKPAARAAGDYRRTAERIAVLLESDETPEPLRGMLYELVEAYRFNMALTRRNRAETTPAFVRRRLPELMARAEREGFIYSDIGETAIGFGQAQK